MLFFFMLFVLGIGSNIAMCSCIITAIRDQFPSVKASHAALGVAFAGFLIGLVYITPVNNDDGGDDSQSIRTQINIIFFFI